MMKKNNICVTINESKMIPAVAGSVLKIDETAIVYNRVVSALVENGYVSRSFGVFATLSLANVVNTPICYKNAVFTACVASALENAKKALKKHEEQIERAEECVKNGAEKDKNGVPMDATELLLIQKSKAFLLTAEDVKLQLLEKKDALACALDECHAIMPESYVSVFKGQGKQALHFELFCSLCTGNVTGFKTLFENCLQSAQLYQHELARANGERSEESKKLFLSFKSNAEILFSRFSVKKDENNKVLCARSIKMSATELNNLAHLLSGLNIEQDANGTMRMNAQSYRKFEKILVAALVLKKQGGKFEITGKAPIFGEKSK